jgi:hypothetical protein
VIIAFPSWLAHRFGGTQGDQPSCGEIDPLGDLPEADVGPGQLIVALDDEGASLECHDFCRDAAH